MASHAQTRQQKVLNLQTYKLHALADYPAQIRMYGTTDSYLTQAVSTLLLPVVMVTVPVHINLKLTLCGTGGM